MKYVYLVVSLFLVLVAVDFMLQPAGMYPYGDPKVFYIPAVDLMLNGTKCNVTLTNTPCNYEHPPLAKLALAASVSVFGHDLLGYAFFPVLFGASSVALVYFVAKKIAGEEAARYASFFLAVDGMFIGMNSEMWLDSAMLLFGLAAVAVYLYDFKHKPVIVGSLLALSLLSKETSIMIAVILLVMELKMKKLGLRGTLVALTSMAVVTIVGLQLYVSTFTHFSSYFDYTWFMVAHNGNLIMTGWPQGPSLSFMGSWIGPASWFLAYTDYQFITTMPEEWLFLAMLPIIIYRYIKVRDARPIIAFSALWLAVTYLSIFAVQTVRPTFPYYMFTVLPGVVILDGWAMTKIPRNMRFAFCAVCFIWLAFFLPMTSGFGLRV